jgi:hypothetical protein
MKIRAGVIGMTALMGLVLCAIASAQDLQLHVTYVCNGERLFIENCNMQNLSDAANCFVGHPDTILSNGMMKYTNETRGSLKKLLPTCKQPSADEIAKEKAFTKKVQDKQDALKKEAEAKLDAPPPTPGGSGGSNGMVKPQTAEQKALNRCITAGRLPASCTGNSLLGAFSQMVSQVLPSLGKEPPPGLNMAGVFEGAGNWRLDFIDGGVLVNCSFLSPNQQNYRMEFKNGRTAIIVDTTPKPLVLTLTADGTIVGPGPLQIDGVVATGYTSGGDGGSSYSGGYHDQYGSSISNSAAASSAGPVFDSSGNRVYGATSSGGAPGHATFSSRTATCPALYLSSKGAGIGMQTMQTDLLKTMFGGDKGAPTPPGLRVHGNYAAQTGFSAEFYPESVIVACGEPARAYPYQVVANGSQTAVKVEDPSHPLLLNMKSDGTLDPGVGSYLVHGRRITGQNNDGDFTFAPLETTCNLGILVPGATASAPPPPVTTVSNTPGNSAAAAAPAGGKPSTMPTGAVAPGNAILSFTSGFVAAQAGGANPLAGRAFVLLRDSFDSVLAKGGFPVPAGSAPYRAMVVACAQRTPDCQTAATAINGQTVAGIRTDATGKATFPGVAPGAYYLMGSMFSGGQILLWDIKVDLRAGANTLVLNQRNATLVR